MKFESDFYVLEEGTLSAGAPMCKAGSRDRTAFALAWALLPAAASCDPIAAGDSGASPRMTIVEAPMKGRNNFPETGKRERAFASGRGRGI
jgi:hypothetical protein